MYLVTRIYRSNCNDSRIKTSTPYSPISNLCPKATYYTAASMYYKLLMFESYLVNT